MSKDLLLEVGLEELPARFIDQAIEQLVQNSKQWFIDNRIKYTNIQSFSTPRRLAIIVEEVSESQDTLKEELRGPSEKIAKNEDGSWSKAAIGFAKGQGKDVNDLYTKEIEGTPYIFVEKITKGQKTEAILPSIKTAISNIQFPQTMFWDREVMQYARPIRWIVALYGEEIIPFEIAKVQSGRDTFGHRFLGERVAIPNPKEYEQILEQQFVIAKAKKRESLISKGIKSLEDANNFSVYKNENLLKEVTNLVEYPTVFSGRFLEDFLQLPEEVLITAMEEHQRYFSVKSLDGELLPYFVAVRNGNQQYIDNVVKGNEKVLEARLSDAQFFYDEDLKPSLDEYVASLADVIFQEQLGTYEEKVKRTKNIANQIARQLKLDESDIEKIERAAHLSKFDLVTLMVNEFPELQGLMGEKYALFKGEDELVAKAIREHYYPKKSMGQLPSNTISAVVSVSDKLDTIVGIISVGLLPTGSQDPYGLRRQAIGVLRILQDQKWDLTVEELLNITLDSYGKSTIERDQIIDFFKLRAQHILKDLNIETDVMKSVLKKGIGHFIYTIDKASLLSKKRNDPSFKATEEALVRTLNLAKNAKTLAVNEKLLQTESEKQLFNKINEVSKQYYHAAEKFDAHKALKYLSELTNFIDEFFEHNLVMDNDQNIRTNRLALLNNIAKLVNHFADLTEIQWKQQAK